MNKVFKVIWSKSLNQWVATSELGKSNKKAKSTHLAKRALPAGITAGALAGLLSFGGIAGAEEQFVLAEHDFNNIDLFMLLGEGSPEALTRNLRAAWDGQGSNSIKIGHNAQSKGDRSVAIGQEANASGSESVAIGKGAEASADRAVALGDSAKAKASQSLVFGHNALASQAASDAIVIGTRANSVASESIVLGVNATASQNADRAVVLGHNASSIYQDTVAVGTGAATKRERSIAIGQNAMVDAFQGIAIGFQAKVNSYEDDSNTSSIAIGDGAAASGRRTIAFGKDAKASGEDTVAIGSGSVVSGRNEVSFGHTGLKRKLTNVAKGDISETSTDAINGSQLWKLEQKIEGAGGEQLVILNEAKDTLIIDNKLASGADTFDISKDNGVRTLTGLAEGKIAEGSKDAVTGSQLHETNEKVADNTQNITTIDNRVTENTQNISNNTTNIENITSGKAGLVQLDGDKIVIDNKLAKDANTFDISKGEEARTLTGVSAGLITAASVDAINGSQLFTTNEALVAALGAGAGFDKETGKFIVPNFKTALDADKDLNSVEEGFAFVNEELAGIQTGATGLVKLNGKKIVIDNELAGGADTFDISGGPNGDRKLTGVAKGKANNDAVNVSQLQGVTDSLGGGAGIDEDGNITAPKYNITNKEGGQVTHNNVGDAFKELDGTVVSNTKNISSLTEVVDGGLTFEGNTGDAINKKLGDTLTIKGGLADDADATAENLRVDVNDDGELVVKMSSNLTGIHDLQVGKPGKDGVDGKIGVHGKDGSSVVLNGKDGSIGLTGKDGKDGTTITFTPDGKPGLDGKDDETDIRIVYKDKEGKDQQVANLNDGLIFGADSGDDVAIKLNEKLDIKGDNNISTSVDGTGIKVNLAKDLNLGKDGSLSFGESGPSITQDGINAGEKVISNVADAEHEKDAVNKGQLDDAVKGITNNAENSLKGIAEAFGGGATVEDGVLTGVDFTEALGADKNNPITNVNDGFAHVTGRLDDHDNRITNIEGDITNITDGKAGLIQLDGEGNLVINNELATGGLFDISNGKEARTLTGVAEGALNENSTDAVNGSQLFETNQIIENINVTNGKNLEGIAKAFGGDAKIEEGVLTDVDFTEALGADENNPITNVNDGFAHVTGKLDTITSGKAGLVQLSDDGKSLVIDNVLAENAMVFDFSNKGKGRILSGVARGTEDNHAVNVSQLKDVTSSLGGGAGFDEEGNYNEPSYEIINKDGEKTTYTNVGDAITNIDGRVTNIDNRVTENTEAITNIGGNVTNLENKLGNSLTGIENAFGGGAKFDEKTGELKAPNYSDALGLVDEDSKIKDGVEAGFEYVGGKLQEHEGKLDGLSSGTSGLVQLSDDGKSLVIDNGLAKDAESFDISNGEDGRTLTGLADGKIAEGSKDAVNGGQIHANNVKNNQDLANIFGGGASIDDNGFLVAPEYELGADATFNNVGDSLNYLAGQISSGEGGLFKLSADGSTVQLGERAKEATTVDMGDRVVTGVTAGRLAADSTDAVNGAQLYATNQQVSSNTTQIKHIQQTMNHYNTQLNETNRRVERNRKVASAGIAGAMAMSSIPYVKGTNYSFGIGFGAYDGQAALSAGFTFKTSERSRARIQASFDSQNKGGVGIGFAYGF